MHDVCRKPVAIGRRPSATEGKRDHALIAESTVNCVDVAMLSRLILNEARRAGTCHRVRFFQTRGMPRELARACRHTGYEQGLAASKASWLRIEPVLVAANAETVARWGYGVGNAPKALGRAQTAVVGASASAHRSIMIAPSWPAR